MTPRHQSAAITPMAALLFAPPNAPNASPNASHTGNERTERRRTPNAWQVKPHPTRRTPNTERISICDIHRLDA